MESVNPTNPSQQFTVFSLNSLIWMMLSFYAAAKVEGVHPMDSGVFRRKYRRDRRVGWPLEHPVIFYARYGWEILSKQVRYVWLYVMVQRAYRHAVQGRIPGADDVAMQPVQVHALETLEMYTTTAVAQMIIEKIKNKKPKIPLVVPIV
jgi:hypothetical protein